MEKVKLENKTIAIIGVGNMGSAIAHSLLRKKVIPAKNLILSNPSLEKLIHFKQLATIITAVNKNAVERADIIILAVKPQTLTPVLQEIKSAVSKNKLIISIAAGFELKTIKKILGVQQSVVRVMPNLCARVSKSMSCWVKSKEVTNEQSMEVKIILQAIGKECLLEEENLLDQVTAISGSGPAYVFYLVELLEKSALKLGLDKKLANMLATQTVVGSVRLLENSKKSVKILREEVTSKGGTTEAAFKKFNKSRFEIIFINAVRAAYLRARELHFQ